MSFWVAVAAALPLGRADLGRRARAAREATDGRRRCLGPGGLAAEHGLAAAVVAQTPSDGTAPARCRAAARRLRAAPRVVPRHDAGSDARVGARRLRVDGCNRRQPDAARRSEGGHRALPRQGAARLSRLADHVLRSRRCGCAADERPDPSAGSARAREVRAAGNRARRSAVAKAVHVGLSVHGSVKNKRPPAVIVLLSDGGQTAGRVTPQQAATYALQNAHARDDDSGRHARRCRAAEAQGRLHRADPGARPGADRSSRSRAAAAAASSAAQRPST